ncbi:MAG: SRPBCC family protein [Chloroflexota bacterium]
MKYKTEVTIDLPREQVIALFDNSENMAKWQDGFISMEHISGEPGQPGAISELKYDMRGRKVEMKETIESNNLPNEMTFIFEVDNVWNRHENYFYEESGQTRWVTDTEFRCTGLMMRTMIFLMPGMFKRETLKQMNAFKAFAESA